MAKDTYIPQHNPEAGSTKDKIISILISESPLNTKKIHFLLKKQYAVSITYQGVHKLLKSLVTQEVLIETDRTYEINSAWLESLKSLLHKMETKYGNRDPSDQVEAYMRDIEGGSPPSSTVLTFPNLEKFSMYMSKAEYLFAQREGEKDKIFIRALKHSWWPILNPKAEFDRIKHFQKNNVKFYVLVEGTHALDKWVQKFFENTNVPCKIGSKFMSNCETGIYNQAVYQIFYGPTILKLIDNIYEEAKELKDVDFASIFQQLWDLNEEIKVIVNSDRDIIRTFIKNAMLEFNLQETISIGNSLISREFSKMESRQETERRINEVRNSGKVQYF